MFMATFLASEALASPFSRPDVLGIAQQVGGALRALLLAVVRGFEAQGLLFAASQQETERMVLMGADPEVINSTESQPREVGPRRGPMPHGV